MSVEEIRREIRHLTSNRAITQTEVAKAIGVKRSAVSQMLKGKHGFSDEKLYRAEAFVKGAYAAVAPQRASLGSLLRWFADLLEEGYDIPWVRLGTPEDWHPDDPIPGGSKGTRVNGGGGGTGTEDP